MTRLQATAIGKEVGDSFTSNGYEQYLGHITDSNYNAFIAESTVKKRSEVCCVRA